MDVITVISVMPNELYELYELAYERHENVGMSILLYRLSTCSRMPLPGLIFKIECP